MARAVQFEDEDETNIKTIPEYKILYSDIEIPKKEADESSKLNHNTTPIHQKIIEYSADCLEGCNFDKDIATKLKTKLDSDPSLNNPSISFVEKKDIEEHGVWQVIVGRQYVASVTFDAKYLIYFYFEECGKYFLVFRS